MGLKPKEKKNNKQKVKRKRGKKFVYAPLSEGSGQQKSNPFESFSSKQFFKAKSNNYSQLVSEYQKRNSANTFIDKRIGENSKLTQDQKLQLRFKAQQLMKTNKRKKFTLNEDEGNEEEITLTHKGKPITEDNIENIQPEDDEEYYYKMNDYIESIETKAHMTKAERLKAIIDQSKRYKQEKQQAKEQNANKIEILDGDFAELASMLKKRKRTFSKFNDDYDKYAANFIYADKVYPTERVKTQEEIELENEMKIKKQNLKRLKEEAIEDDEEEDNNKGREKIGADEIGGNAKQMTKKERIEKLIQERLEKSQKIHDSRENSNNNNNKGNNDQNEEEEEEEEDDSNSDLNEFYSNNEEEEAEDEEDEQEEENNDDNDLSINEEESENEEEEEEDEDIQILKKMNKK